MIPDAPEADSMVVKNYAMLCFGGVRLLIPQENVATVEASEEIAPASNVAGAIGSLLAEGGEWPVFVLNEKFEPRAECPPAYLFCVAVSCGNGGAFAIACDDVSKISITDGGGFVPLQACMRLPNGPIESLMPRNGKLLLLSDVDAMWQYLVQERAA
ncbi:MAG: hypothetical protein JRE18_03535 [Deltaproteobacteria bacterium]|jgi:hypothetical protein|nr:hypothetical protein [Deltaproteobacteria bacterium]